MFGFTEKEKREKLINFIKKNISVISTLVRIDEVDESLGYVSNSKEQKILKNLITHSGKYIVVNDDYIENLNKKEIDKIFKIIKKRFKEGGISPM